MSVSFRALMPALLPIRVRPCNKPRWERLPGCGVSGSRSRAAAHERSSGRDLRLAQELERTQWLGRAQLLDLQFARLREHVQFAYDHTVYYRRLLDEHELPPHRIQSPGDFRRIPPLTRDLLRRHFGDLQSHGARLGRVQRMSTGGSTGNPVILRT